MSTVVVVLIGFGAGLLTMTIMSFYKWFLKVWNRDLEQTSCKKYCFDERIKK